jgi:hypothetical protein
MLLVRDASKHPELIPATPSRASDTRLDKSNWHRGERDRRKPLNRASRKVSAETKGLGCKGILGQVFIVSILSIIAGLRYVFVVPSNKASWNSPTSLFPNRADSSELRKNHLNFRTIFSFVFHEN